MTVADALLLAIETGDFDGLEDAYGPDALFDASVPSWNFQRHGAREVVAQLREWFATPGRLIERNVVDTAEGVVVDFERRWRCPGDASHAAHDEGCRQAHVLRIVDGRIAAQRVWCAGAWDGQTLARLDAERLQTSGIRA